MERRWPNSVTFHSHLEVQLNSFECYGRSAVDDYAPDSMGLLPMKMSNQKNKNVGSSHLYLPMEESNE